MQCNIDAHGKAIRLKIGLFSLAAAAALAGVCFAGLLQGPWWWCLIAGAAAGGSFAVFEARAGWCAVRAMGFKTPF